MSKLKIVEVILKAVAALVAAAMSLLKFIDYINKVKLEIA